MYTRSPVSEMMRTVLRNEAVMASKIVPYVGFCLSIFYGSMLAGQSPNLPNQKPSSNMTVDEKRRQFFALDRSQVLRQSGARNLNDSPVDNYIASAIKRITSSDEPDYLSCRNVDVHIVGSGGSRFHPAAGLLIDRAQIRDLTNALPNAPLRLVALFVVAHECGHAWQFKRYPLSVMEHQALWPVHRVSGRFVGGDGNLATTQDTFSHEGWCGSSNEVGHRGLSRDYYNCAWTGSKRGGK